MSRKKAATLTGSGFTAVDCLHPKLLGHAFAPTESWHAWSVILRAIEGLPIADTDMELYRRLTGRASPPTAPASEVWISAGRRSGKSRVGALLAVHAAAFVNWRARLALGEVAVIACLAADKAQARVIHGYCRGLVDGSPLIAAHAIDSKADALAFDTLASVEVHASDFRSLRGRSFALVIADEVAFWESGESANPDQEIIRAVRPGLATLGGRLIGISSPYAQRGVLFEQFRKHWGKDGDPVLVVRADSRTLNPSLSEHVIAEALATDIEGARAEWLGEFRSDLSDLFTPEALERCTAKRRQDLPPSPTARHVGASDAAGGGGASSRDGYAAACVHVERGRVVVDWMELVRPPFDPLEVTARLCHRFRQYQIRTVHADQWSLGTITAEAKRHGVLIERRARSTSDDFLEFAATINATIVELPDDRELRNQLEALQRSTRSGGRDRVEHRRGEHDDLAAAVARACVVAAAGLRRSFIRPMAIPTERPTVEVIETLPHHVVRRGAF